MYSNKLAQGYQSLKDICVFQWNWQIIVLTVILFYLWSNYKELYEKHFLQVTNKSGGKWATSKTILKKLHNLFFK